MMQWSLQLSRRFVFGALVWACWAPLLASCKTGEGGGLAGRVSADSATPAPLTLAEVADAPAEQPRFEKRSPDDTSELTGYDEMGALTCLPLPPGRECLQREEPLAGACKDAGGQLLRCEDCSQLCSRSLGADGD